MQHLNKVYYTDREIKQWVHQIIRSMNDEQWRPDYIVGISRGGLVPAVMLSQYLNIPLRTLEVSLRDNGNCTSDLGMAEDAFGHNLEISKKILIVDDINDTGATLNWIKEDWPSGCFPNDNHWNFVWNQNVRFAVMIHNDVSKFKNVDYIGKTINKHEKDEWCVFPWESWWE